MMIQAFLKIFAEEVLKSRWNVSESEKIAAAAAKLYTKLSSAESQTERKSLWKKPQVALSVLSALDDISLFIFLLHIDVTLFED